MSVGVPAVLELGGSEVPRLLAQVEARMDELVRGYGPDLGRLAAETVSAGGKRLRPVLVGLAAGVPVPLSPELARCAVAVELIHAATLVHDDVLDRAELRRGRPTVVARAGRVAATAAGDLLFSRAFAELAASGAGSVAQVQVLARACAELAAGELMQRQDAFDYGVSEARYLERCRLKTAVLFRAACELGALAGGAPREPVAEFGEAIGLAFQILDDVLDVTGPPQRTGKPRGSDLLDGTVTLPLLLAAAEDPQLAGLDPGAVATVAQAAEVCDRIAATSALARCREQAQVFVERARAALDGLESRQRSALELVAAGVVERYA